MKNGQNRLAGLKYHLRSKKAEGKKEIIQKLSGEQLIYIEKLGYQTIPWLYEITTKRFINVKNADSALLKDIHYANKNGKRKIYRTLKRQEIKVLDDRGIYYRPYKFKIIL